MRAMFDINKNFKECMTHYDKTKDEEFLELMYEKYDWLKEAMETLGFKEIKRKKYMMGNIRRAVEVIKYKEVRENLPTLLKDYLRKNNVFEIGRMYTLKEAKRMLKDIVMNKMGLSIVPPANILLKVYNAKISQKRVEGVETKHVKIMGW